MISSKLLRFGRDVFVKRSLHCQCLVYSSYGDPNKVLKLEDREESDELSSDQIRIRWMAAPVNPADINMIQGIYPIKPTLPAVGGNEGVGRVEKIGSNVSSFSVGDWVLPSHAGQGTWRTHSVCVADDLLPVSRDLPLTSAATLLVNPPTAYRMLTDFQKLSPGDVVVQNGANSGVGRAVIQIAKQLGLKTINIIRNRTDLDDVKRELEALAPVHVLTDDEFRKNKRIWTRTPAPKLALNCVGGKSVVYLASCLAAKGKLVTYGGMSKLPLQIPTGPLIFKDIELHGFWMSRWYLQKENRENAIKMLEFLTKMIIDGDLKEKPCETTPLSEYGKTIESAISGRKQILLLE